MYNNIQSIQVLFRGLDIKVGYEILYFRHFHGKK